MPPRCPEYDVIYGFGRLGNNLLPILYWYSIHAVETNSELQVGLREAFYLWQELLKLMREHLVESRTISILVSTGFNVGSKRSIILILGMYFATFSKVFAHDLKSRYMVGAKTKA